MSAPMVFILTDEPVMLNQRLTLDVLMQRHPDVAPARGDKTNENGPFVVVLNGVVLAVLAPTGRLPDGWQPAAQRARGVWPEAADACARHGGHIIVTTMGDHPNRVLAARNITAMCGALLAVHRNAIAVVWDGIVINSRHAFLDLSGSAFASDPPSPLWVSTHFFNDSKDSSTVGGLTLGLRKFLGWEIEVDGSTKQRESVVELTVALSSYALKDGVRLHDGGTINATEQPRIPLRMRESARLPGTPVLSASLSR